MTDIERTTVERITGCTMNIIDRHKCLAAIYYAEKRGCKDEAIQIILSARQTWLEWIIKTQRKWQMETRNKNKARHHDSIEIREKYVRCNGI
jgi:site-specific recombinase XerC